ncbi:PREDICTED: carbonic anhydrase 15-like [Nicrophorus vespilloides]|uniref:Carbonic anhydrase n=1 Tax=Nicrophorus vespilloides TaxID=110193 RepID=A0ABM1MMN3_NICVS|nr:PREDICTED: carbonic anhydrase 15-like [Nicrophorus vespilloides]
MHFLHPKRRYFCIKHQIDNNNNKMRFAFEFLVSVYCFFGMLSIGSGQDFGYEGTVGPNFWGEKYHHCIGKHQSPINIEEHNVEMVKLFPMQFENFDFVPEEAVIKNNGHTVIVTINSTKMPLISGGPLLGKYQFAQLHFHWGSDDSEGSENKINNSSYPMELHMVFFQRAYGTIQDAIDHPDGLTVLSFLYSNAEVENSNYNAITEVLPDIEEANTSLTMTNMPTFDQMLMKNRSIYFTYGGSLTTPPCSEVVTWIEFKNTIPLAHSQVIFI